jgi:hypothetical protein
MESKSTTASLPTQARTWIAVGFAAVAIAAVMSNTQAIAGSAEPAASGSVIAPAAPLADLASQVDWSRLPLSNITPAETVAAYDR